MTAGVRGDLVVQFTGKYYGANDLGQVEADFDVRGLLRLAQGTGNGEADLFFSDERTIAASSNETLDLAGSLADPFGVTLTFAKVNALVFLADAGNTNDVVVSPGASNPFNGPFGGTTPTISIGPGGMFAVTRNNAGWAVTASTGDLLKVANSSSGSSVKYRVIVIGKSA